MSASAVSLYCCLTLTLAVSLYCRTLASHSHSDAGHTSRPESKLSARSVLAALLCRSVTLSLLFRAVSQLCPSSDLSCLLHFVRSPCTPKVRVALLAKKETTKLNFLSGALAIDSFVHLLLVAWLPVLLAACCSLAVPSLLSSFC